MRPGGARERSIEVVVSPASGTRTALLDSPHVQTLEPAFKALSHKTKTAPLRHVQHSSGIFSYQQMATALSQACETLGTGPLTLYQLRHAGVSFDISQGWRQVNEVERRGSKSMHPYEQSSGQSTDYARFSASQRNLFESCEGHLTVIIMEERYPVHLLLGELQRIAATRLH